MNNQSEIVSVLKLIKMYFNKIEFIRKGFKNENTAKFNFKTQFFEQKEQNLFKVSLTTQCEKKDEYNFEIELIGIFSFSEDSTFTGEEKNILLTKNAVAILMPYMRSQISLLTAQPDTDCVVLPPFNINNMIKE